jgi:hypothetical protein
MVQDETPQHVPPPSLWPVGFALGVICILVGVVISWWVAAVGAAVDDRLRLPLGSGRHRRAEGPGAARRPGRGAARPGGRRRTPS